MLTKNLLLCLFFSFSVFATTATAYADQSPEKALEATINKVVDVLHVDDASASIETKRGKVLAVLESSFSFDIIIRRALGRNWNELNEEQQEAITILVTDLLINAYTKELKNGPKPEITFLKSESLSSNKLEIPTKVSYKGTQVAVSYRLANIKNRGWQVYDVLVEGVSLVGNYREQFDSHFQTKSAADLINLLKDKLKNFDA